MNFYQGFFYLSCQQYRLINKLLLGMFPFLLDLFFINIIIIVVVISFKLQNLIWDFFFFLFFKDKHLIWKISTFSTEMFVYKENKKSQLFPRDFFSKSHILKQTSHRKNLNFFPLGMFVHIYKKNLNFLYKMFVCKEKKIPDHMFEKLIIMILPIWIVKGS